MGLDPQDLAAIRAAVREELEAEAEREQHPTTASALERLTKGFRDGETARAAEES
jgi:hypothetical protein